MPAHGRGWTDDLGGVLTGKLDLDPRAVAEARRVAALAAEPVIEMARTRTTVSVQRATLRLAGLSGADPASFSAGEGAATQPWVSTVVDAVREQVGLRHGVALPVWHALGSGEYADLHELAAKTAAGSVRYALPEGKDAGRADGQLGLGHAFEINPALCRGAPERSESAADVPAAPVVVVRASGTVVIP